MTVLRLLVLAAVVAAAGSSEAGAATYGGGALTVADLLSPPTLASPYPSVITVSGGGVIQDVDVRLAGVAHDAPADLDVLLVGPAGQAVTLLSDAAGASLASTVDVTLDDEAAMAVPDDPQLRAVYRPTDNPGDADTYPAPAPAAPYATALSAFDGTFADGEWRLHVTDDTAGGGGTIGTWVLRTSERSRASVHVVGGGAPESAGVLRVQVSRDPSATLAGQVDFATAGVAATSYAVATPGADYVPVSGTLTFAPGQTVATFDVPLVDDKVVEPPTEAVPVTLSTARGDARLGGGDTAVSFMTINDDDTAPRTAPSVAGPVRVAGPSLRAARTQHLLRQRLAVRLTARATVAGTVTATGTITIPRRAKPVVLKSARVAVRPGVAAKLALAVRKADTGLVRRALRRHRKLAATVAARVDDGAGHVSRFVTVRLTLKP